MPLNLNTNEVTGVDLNNTEVSEVRLNGQTVFSAAPSNLPVAYSNLVAWYPFDSATYGGSNADDVTALFNSGQSGDSTAFDGLVNGATYQSSGGVKDINAGANSGAFDFDGSNDNIDLGANTFEFLNGNECSFCCWFKADDSSDIHNMYNQEGVITLAVDDGELKGFVTGTSSNALFTSVSANTFFHGVLTFDGVNTQKLYLDGVLEDTGTGSMFDLTSLNRNTRIGAKHNDDNRFNGVIDDLRIYDKELSASEVFDIYDNTQP